LSLAISIALGGCASTGSKSEDVWQGWNQGTQEFNDDFDKYLLKPVAKGYEKITPDIVDEGVTNFFSNMNDIGVTINDVLQLKFLQGGMDLSRFIINTTAGVGGVMDVAKLLDLPKHDEDFGQTLGFWGIPAGPYLVIPFAGPSSPRDFIGMLGDAMLNPLTYVSAFGGFAGGVASGSAGALDVTDTRAGLMSTEKVVQEGAVNRYDFIKNSYEQHREYLIHDGNPPSEDVDTEDTDSDSSDTNNGSGGSKLTNSSTNTSSTNKDNTVNSGSLKTTPATVKPVKPTTSTPATGKITSSVPAPAMSTPKHSLQLSAPK
jgi:phospholipid-binding lipoprotein MlaA